MRSSAREPDAIAARARSTEEPRRSRIHHHLDDEGQYYDQDLLEPVNIFIKPTKAVLAEVQKFAMGAPS
jgi:hypothetical protein